jgi:redox-sensitive bicupin YhaK (pirin superfamily)
MLHLASSRHAEEATLTGSQIAKASSSNATAIAGSPAPRQPARSALGEGSGRTHARPAQLVLLGPGEELAVSDAAPGTRFLLMTGQPYGELPMFNGPYVD